MKALIPATTGLCALLLIASCNNDRSYSTSAESKDAAVSVADTVAAPGAAAAPFAAGAEADKPLRLDDPARKIIKTADLRCRVADVFAATTRIERFAAATGGQIADSHLENTTEETRLLPYTSDSLRQLRAYTTTAHLTLRIPVAQLDTVLSDIAAGAAFIESRNLHLDDVTLRYLGNKLKNDAMTANDAAQRARTLARRSGEAVYSGDYTDARDGTRIDRRIENLQLSDQSAYATLTVDLYQPQRISAMAVPDSDILMKPTIGQEITTALSNGWRLLRALLIGLLQVWPLLIIAGLAVVLFRRRLKPVFAAKA